MFKKMIEYVGWIGYNNLGDEALFFMNKKEFKKYVLVYQRKISKIMLFGGGTLNSNWMSRIIPKKYNYAYGIGIRDPSFWGKDYFLINQFKKFNFRFIGVRDIQTKQFLDNYGIQSELIGDSTLFFKTSEYKKRDPRKIVINLRGEANSLIWGRNEKKVIKEITELCKNLKVSGYNPILISFWKKESKTIQKISDDANIHYFKDWKNIQEVIDMIGSSNILIGEKLHSIIFSAATYTPFISIEYRPKCKNFAETVGFKKYVIRTDKISSKKLNILFSNLLENWSEMHEILVTNVNYLREKQKTFLTKLKNDIDLLPQSAWSPPNIIETIRWLPGQYNIRMIKKIANKIKKII